VSFQLRSEKRDISILGTDSSQLVDDKIDECVKEGQSAHPINVREVLIPSF